MPSATVNMSVELQAKKTAEEVAGGLVKLVEDKKPTLVIWQTMPLRYPARPDAGRRIVVDDNESSARLDG